MCTLTLPKATLPKAFMTNLYAAASLIYQQCIGRLVDLSRAGRLPTYPVFGV